jgi:signal transduction histidine kinase
MSELLKDLISFSILIKRDNKKMTNVDLNYTLQNIIKDFQPVIGRKKAIVNLSPLPSIKAEPLQMNQLFHNLISNALKFCSEKPVINITSKAGTAEDFSMHQELKKDTSYVSISVQDNGIGFEQKYVPIIFTIFQRLNKNDETGTGMGLAICKKIIENHNGFIFANGQEDAGATFTVFLPT